jgi:hypothetical protein
MCETDGEQILFEYKPKQDGRFNGTLNALSCQTTDGNQFLPSYYGGPTLNINGQMIPPYSGAVSYQLVRAWEEQETLFLEWHMNYGSHTYPYTYAFHISGQTLVIDVTSEATDANFFHLDRSQDTFPYSIVYIPYWTLSNVLFTHDSFVSMFFDWQRSNATQLVPLDGSYSGASARFAQNALYETKTDGSRNPLSERIYLTVSSRLNDVLPNIPNPVSPMRHISADHLVWDLWLQDFSNVKSYIEEMGTAGITDLWIIEHNWQHAGYDNAYPNVLPANPLLGGEGGLKAVSQTAKRYGYLFALHENYVDMYENADDWNPDDLALDKWGDFRVSWQNPQTGLEGYLIKPERAAFYAQNFSPRINNDYTTSAAYLDVHSAAPPSNKVDYDASHAGAAMFRNTWSHYCDIAGIARQAHQGPVSGEGQHHFLYAGYYDDFSAQIHTGHNNSEIGGVWLPLLVDFHLEKIRDKTMSHGVGYYPRFFVDENHQENYLIFEREHTLIYIATTLAYGHAGAIPSPWRVDHYLEAATLHHRHVLPVQRHYADARPVSILYSDNGVLRTASEYIGRYPHTFDEYDDPHFMSQVRVEYDNGVIVCVNRHPSRSWTVDIGEIGGWFSQHTTLQQAEILDVGFSPRTVFVLPPESGWVVYSPHVHNQDPVVLSSPPTCIQVGEFLDYRLQVQDADGHDVSFERIKAPTWLQFDPALGVLSGTPSVADTGDYVIVIRLDDGHGGCVDHSFQLRVEETNTLTAVYRLPRDTWCMMSFPVIPEDNRIETVFADYKEVEILQWDAGINSYRPAERVEPGRGYWLHSPVEEQIAVAGEALDSYRIQLERGWTLVGALTDPTHRNALSVQPSQSLGGRILGWDLETISYFPVQTIEAWDAFWIYSKNDAELSLSYASSLALDHSEPFTLHDPDIHIPDPPGISGHPDKTERLVKSDQVRVLKNFPNPFNSSTMIPIELDEDGTVSMRIFNLYGQTIRTMEHTLSHGRNQLYWDGRNDAGSAVVSGMYCIHIYVGEKRYAQQVLLLR